MIRACLCAPKSFEQIHHVVPAGSEVGSEIGSARHKWHCEDLSLLGRALDYRNKISVRHRILSGRFYV